MVSVEEVVENEIPRSEERRLDADAIEKTLDSLTRPTARMHIETLVKKLRKESEALKKVEKSQQKSEEGQQNSSDISTTEEVGKNKVVESLESDATEQVLPQPAATPPQPAATPPQPAATPIVLSPGMKYVSIDRFSFDFGGYNSSFVTLYIALPGVGSIPRDNITCSFTSTSFDLIVKDLNGKSYRLFKDNLEKDIIPDKSKRVVKADKVVVKLAKVKGEYGSYDHWSQLSAKKTKKEAPRGKSNPQASIMDMMKDMYDSGDDSMKKMIAETMIKQRNGELDTPNYGKDLGGMGESF